MDIQVVKIGKKKRRDGSIYMTFFSSSGGLRLSLSFILVPLPLPPPNPPYSRIPCLVLCILLLATSRVGRLGKVSKVCVGK
ncbi:hypothetical protein F5X99DRAFT_376840 [Biscogniauxia marginata]|nr:hypothetical protein F5X99DRAFT_376840 [Biscogniauxia marginata]